MEQMSRRGEECFEATPWFSEISLLLAKTARGSEAKILKYNS
jgi:hypothetical protein